jgi:hypothetical protein
VLTQFSEDAGQWPAVVTLVTLDTAEQESAWGRVLNDLFAAWGDDDLWLLPAAGDLPCGAR